MSAAIDQAANGDFETYSEAGYVWDVGRQKWESLPGHSTQKRGLSAVGTDNYVNHPTFHPSTFAYRLPSHDRVHRVEFPEAHLGVAYPCPADLRAWIESGGTFEAWNVGFDGHYVWQWCVRHWGWPELPLSQQRCTMAKARASAYPGALDNAAEVLGTPRKDAIGGRLVSKLTVPKNPTKKQPDLRWTPQTAAHDFAVFYDYNSQDVTAEIAAGNALPDMLPFEVEVWRMDQAINRRGMCIDLVSVEHCIAILQQAQLRADAELQRLTLWPVKARDATGAEVDVWVPAVEAHTEVAAMVRWCNWRGLRINELDEETLAECLKLDIIPPDVRRVLRIRQELAFGSVKKLYSLKARTSADGRIRECYMYSGAHTTLWNGMDPQPANFPRPMHDSFEKIGNVSAALRVIACESIELLDLEYGKGSPFEQKHGTTMDPLEVVASCLRSLIVAAPGHRLISADFNSIQAVVTSCLAGCEWRIKVFETHGKIYEAMGARLTGLTLEEVLEHKVRTGKHHSCRQNPGKLAVLSGDFGAWIDGWKRFHADKLLGSDENIKAAILKTRREQPEIGELWGGQVRNKFGRDQATNEPAVERAELYGLEGAIIAAIRSATMWRGTILAPIDIAPTVRLHPGFEVPSATASGHAFEVAGCVYQMHGATLYCRVPSGGLLRYHNARLSPSKRPYARPWEVEISYEGWNTNPKKGAQGWQTMKLYAGLATQNVVAKISREVQALALLRLEANGYPVVMHTHDENVCEVPIGSHHTAAEHTKLTGLLPPWAVLPDGRPWPIRVPDSWEAPFYGKW